MVTKIQFTEQYRNRTKEYLSIFKKYIRLMIGKDKHIVCRRVSRPNEKLKEIPENYLWTLRTLLDDEFRSDTSGLKNQ